MLIYGFLTVRFRMNAMTERESNNINGTIYPPLETCREEQAVAINAAMINLRPKMQRLVEKCFRP